MNINGRMKVKTLKSQFLDEFGLTIRVYDGRGFADDNSTLASIRKNGKKGGGFRPQKNTKVGNLEKKLADNFGLKTQIAGSDDSYLCDNNRTLRSALEEDKKKLIRKSRKNERQNIENRDCNENSELYVAEFDADDLVTDEVDDDFNAVVEDEVDEKSWFDSDDNSAKNKLRLTFKNSGGEFEHHRFDSEDIKFLKESFEDDPDGFLEYNLLGGESFSKEFWSGSYGPSMDGMAITIEEDNTTLDLDKVNKNRIFFTDGLTDITDKCLDFFYITTGSVFGSYLIELQDDEVFDPSKLTINYIEYSLDGYQEQYGTIIHNIEYNGELCDADIEDNGTDIYRSVLGYDLWDGDLEDYLVVYDTNGQADWDWDLCTEIFGEDIDFNG